MFSDLPKLVEIEPTLTCNLRCRMCHVSYMPDEPRPMFPAELAAVNPGYERQATRHEAHCAIISRRILRPWDAVYGWASPTTLMRPRARLRGFVLTKISTSWPSAVSSRIRRSLEKFARRPLRRAETFG